MYVVPDIDCSMSDLALTFPTLEKAEGLYPFDAPVFAAWACNARLPHGGLYAAQFVLAVYSGRAARFKRTKALMERGEVQAYLFRAETPWRIGPFDVVDALSTWDSKHRAAFVAWARAPWYP